MADDREPPPAFTPPEGYTLIDWTRGFGRTMGPLYERIEASGRYSRGFLVEERHTNGLSNAHGGMLMSFADIAFGHVVSVERSSYWVTVRLTCDFVAAAHLGDFVEGAGEIMGVDDDLFTIRGRLWVGERTIMTGHGLFKALHARPPRRGEKAHETA